MDSKSSGNPKPNSGFQQPTAERKIELAYPPSSLIKPHGQTTGAQPRPSRPLSPLEDMRAPLPPERRFQTQNSYIPRPMPQEKESGTNWKKIGGLGFIALIFGKVIVHMFAGAVVTQGEVELSKFTSWSAEEKQQAVDSCQAEAIKSLQTAPTPSPIPQDKVMAVTASYCSCMVNKVESAHVLATKYNTLTQSREAAVNHVRASLNEYLETPEGKSALNECIQTAKGSAGL